MAKKKKASMATRASTIPDAEAPSLSNTSFTTIPAVQAGRHPWFYFEDGTIVLKVDYPRLQLDSGLDFAPLAATRYPLQGSPTFSDRVLACVQRYVDLRVLSAQ